jgi:hypothetical protein
MKHVALIVSSDIADTVKHSPLRMMRSQDFDAWVNCIPPFDVADPPENVTVTNITPTNLSHSAIKIVKYADHIEFHVDSRITAKSLGQLEHHVFKETSRRYPDKQFDSITIHNGKTMNHSMKNYITKRFGGASCTTQ